MKRYLVRFLFSLIFCPFFLLLMVGQTFAHSSSSTAFNCPLFGTHCYGLVSEYASGQSSSSRFWGMTTAVDARILSYMNPSVPGFIDNEMWLADSLEPSVCTLQGGACWIEMGYEYARTSEVYNGIPENSLGTHMFWADVRPQSTLCTGSGCNFQMHIKGLFSLGTTDAGKKITMTISNTGFLGLGNCQWKVSASMPGKSFMAYSTNNCIKGASHTQVGSEMAGSGFSGINVNAPATYFDTNRYQSAAGGGWTSYTSLGSVVSQGPPWAGYIGGRFHTCTGYSSC